MNICTVIYLCACFTVVARSSPSGPLMVSGHILCTVSKLKMNLNIARKYMCVCVCVVHIASCPL